MNILVSSDWHIGLGTKALDKFTKVINQPYDHYVVLGDVVDFLSISRFANAKEQTESILRETILATKYLQKHADILRKKNKNIKLHFLAGNHEQRLDKLLGSLPALDELLSVKQLLNLNQSGYTYTQYGDSLKIKQVSFCHGVICGVNHSRTVANQSDGISIYGHVHNLESATAKRHGRKSRAYSAGCLCDLNPKYLQGVATNWENGYITIKSEKDIINVYQHRL